MNKEKGHKILVCIDCQEDFVTGALGSDEAQKRIAPIVDKIKSFDGDLVIFTLDTHGEDYLETKEGKALPVKHCIKGTKGWSLVKEVELAREYLISKGITTKTICKPTFGSAYRIGDEKSLTAEILDATLIDGVIKGIPTEIEFVGFCTDICVISNVLIMKALTHDFADITVDASCCAGVTKEKHDAAIEVMRSCQINIINQN